MIVLDTHIWFWLIAEDFERFPSSWKTKIESEGRVGVSPVSCYEIALASSRGRLELPCSSDVWFDQALKPSGIELLSLDEKVACQAVQLSAVHKDPFDRMIIATALIYGDKLASVDKVYPNYPELNGHLMERDKSE